MENENGGKVAVPPQNQDGDTGTKYTIPGILHFIQHEWARFEMDRAHWDVERAELQARIAFLQGERKGQENLKHDLIRRIKMLEYALKQERAKYHRLKYGTDVSPDKVNKEEDSTKREQLHDINTNNTKAGVNWRQGRQLLRQYLTEVGYTDTILDVRSSRIRSILGLSVADGAVPEQYPTTNAMATKDRPDDVALIDEQVRPPKRGDHLPNNRKLADGEPDENASRGRRAPVRPAVNSRGPPLADDLETEAAVLANFDFLQNDVEDEEENDDDLDDGGSADDESEDRDDLRMGRRITKRSKPELGKDAVEEMLTGDDETADALAEFDFMIGEDSGSETDVTVIEVDGNGEMLEDVDITIPEEPEFPSTQGENKDSGSGQNDWGVDPNVLAKLKEQYKKERKTKKSPKRPPRSTLQAMLANLGGDEEGASSTPAPPVINVPPPVRLSGSRATSEIPPIASVSIGGKVLATPVATSVDEPFESALGLGELAGLTVSNEAEALSYEVTTKEEFRKTWSPKFTLRSHFDSIRSLFFHPTEAALITASEDHSLKLWNLQKTVPQKKSNIFDVEPIYTFRGHSAPVLAVVVNSTSEMCFSGSADSTILCWNIPPLDVDSYGPYSCENLGGVLVAHTDAVWGLAVQTSSLQLLSASADGTCKLWSPTLKSPLLNTYQPNQVEGWGVPTSVDFVRTETSQMVASYSTANCAIYDLETATAVVRLDSTKTYNNSPSTQINKVVSHPTLPLTVTAHEDRHIRFFDNSSGKQVHSMVAHLDAVTSLAVDPNGLYLLSGSHDCSIRLWNLDSKTCVQEITSHRKKFDEAIYDVAFHPNRPYIASAGADGLAKVFV